MHIIGFDILVESLYETFALVPYLYLTYLALEYMEHKTSEKTLYYIKNAGNLGPVIGGLLGLVPQCGFSVVAANLYATGIITLGTLFAIFLSTSDEMLPILLSNGVHLNVIIAILGLKVIYAIIAGFIVSSVLLKRYFKHKNLVDIEEFCKREKCDCNHKDNIWRSAFKHTEKISIFIFIFSAIVNAIFTFGGKETISDVLIGFPILSKFIAAAVGLIPSCYPSVLLTQLYLDSAISLGTMLAGTLSNAGLGLLVLYRVNPNQNENLRIFALLYGFGVVFGIITEFLIH